MSEGPKDFAFHWDGGGVPWDSLHVVSFTFDDAIGRPYALELCLHARDAALDPAELVGKVGTLQILTRAEPAVRVVHGLMVHAEDAGGTETGHLYRVRLAPPWARASHRKRSRIFLEKSTRSIIESVLLQDPHVRLGEAGDAAPSDFAATFAPPVERLVWRLADPTRIDSPAVRPFVVQYQETDFDFVARLLEEEGIGYHFEHTASSVTLVLTDHDGGRPRLEPFQALAANREGRHLDWVRAGGTLRPHQVRLVEYNWQKPNLAMTVEARSTDGDLVVEEYPGQFVDEPALGAPLAERIVQRWASEAHATTAKGSCRLLGAGSIFKLEHAVARYEGEYLVTEARLRGITEGEHRPEDEPLLPGGVPFLMEVRLARRGRGDAVQDSNFRPPLRTPRPKIVGTQTAMVVAEPGMEDAEIHVGGPPGNENGCVRLRFHWDTEAERLKREPASAWVRVSQISAGAGGGAVAHPRVGTEVVVAFEDGDPERPMVVGRVYNGVQPAPALGRGAAKVTTLKSLSSPGGKVFNEFQFNDSAGEEQVNLTAGRDWNTTVGHNRAETVANDSVSKVALSRHEQTGASRTTQVGANNSETVGGSESVSIGGRRATAIAAGEDHTVGADRNVTVGGPHAVSVASETYSVAAGALRTVGASQEENIGANYALSAGGDISVTAGASHTLTTPRSITHAPTMEQNAEIWAVSASAIARIDAAEVSAVADAGVTVQGATVVVTASGDILISGTNVQIKGATISLEGGSVKIAGGTVDITGGVVKVN